jgi:hypothetical protein
MNFDHTKDGLKIYQYLLVRANAENLGGERTFARF